MTRAQRMHRKLIEMICFTYDETINVAGCFRCHRTESLEIDHPEGRRRAARNRNPEHRRKSFLQRMRELWEAFASDEPLRVLCRSCNAREGGGRRYR